ADERELNSVRGYGRELMQGRSVRRYLRYDRADYAAVADEVRAGREGAFERLSVRAAVDLEQQVIVSREPLELRGVVAADCRLELRRRGRLDGLELALVE